MRIRSLLAIAFALVVQQSWGDDCNLESLDPVKLDKNQNGVINRKEAEGTSLTWVFDKVDSDNNGIITQAEFAKRCEATDTKAAAKKSESNEKQNDTEDSVVAKKAERQVDRTANKVDNRVDKETDEAVDKVIDKGLDRLFKR